MSAGPRTGRFRVVRTNTERAPDTADRLDELSWAGLADRFRRDPRLLLPVGSCIQHGPHLPLGTDSLITSRLARDVCRRTGILLAPLLPFGVASAEDLAYAGTAGLERKTLHRVLNELVQSWERQGLKEVTLLTTNGNTRNIQALAMVMGDTVRVRSIDTRAIDVSHVLEEASPTAHAGVYETSLMLHVAPELVRSDGNGGALPAGSTAEKGQELYEYLVDSIVGRLRADDL